MHFGGNGSVPIGPQAIPWTREIISIPIPYIGIKYTELMQWGTGAPSTNMD